MALLAVLGTIALIVPMTMLGTNRVDSELRRLHATMSGTRLKWAAHGCLASFRAAAEGVESLMPAHGTSTHVVGDTVWRDTIGVPCAAVLSPMESPLVPDAADGRILSQALQARGTASQTADALTAAVIDWSDPDDVDAAGGSEAAWYRSLGRDTPRNAQPMHSRELWLVRGVVDEQVHRALVGALDDLRRARCAATGHGTRSAESIPRGPEGASAADVGCGRLRVTMLVWDRDGTRRVGVTAMLSRSGDGLVVDWLEPTS
jgi:hypothetical protein